MAFLADPLCDVQSFLPLLNKTLAREAWSLAWVDIWNYRIAREKPS